MSPPILLVLLPRTRDALIVGPQAFLILQRHRAAVALRGDRGRRRRRPWLCWSGPRRRPRLRSASSSSRWAASADGLSSRAAALSCCQRARNRSRSASRPAELVEQPLVELFVVSSARPAFRGRDRSACGRIRDWPRRRRARCHRTWSAAGCRSECGRRRGLLRRRRGSVSLRCWVLALIRRWCFGFAPRPRLD